MTTPTKNVTIYTDGSCLGNPGPGGWGAVLIYNKHEKHISGNAADTTNNRMELKATIEALQHLKEPCNVVLFTDSSYVQKGISEWIENWKARGWKTKHNKPVKNVDLWQELDTARERHIVDWQWVKGHSGDHYNEIADDLAQNAAAAQQESLQ